MTVTDVAVNKSSLLSRKTFELKLGRHVAETMGYMNPRSATRVEFVPMSRPPVGGGLDFALFSFLFLRKLDVDDIIIGHGERTDRFRWRYWGRYTPDGPPGGMGVIPRGSKKNHIFEKITRGGPCHHFISRKFAKVTFYRRRGK